uniref:Uncharacterized protein n=1 Tax=Lepeophtheirus salmonis TaxID=72036 RepID=A0A0K2UNS4_LEPSM
MFLRLKRYNTDSSTLFRAGPEMTKYVKNIRSTSASSITYHTMGFLSS